MVYEAATYEEALEAYEVFSEQYGDLKTQFDAEVAHYGDAWPGAQQQLDAAWKALVDAEKALKAFSPEEGEGDRKSTGADGDGDIPF